MPSFISVETVTTNTHSEGFGQPGAEVVEHDGDDVLVRDVGVARFEVHLPRPHQVQGVLKRDLRSKKEKVSAGENMFNSSRRFDIPSASVVSVGV